MTDPQLGKAGRSAYTRRRRARADFSEIGVESGPFHADFPEIGASVQGHLRGAEDMP